jgi:FKBP-type peptidyl-prolyl cis-trans isomerase
MLFAVYLIIKAWIEYQQLFKGIILAGFWGRMIIAFLLAVRLGKEQYLTKDGKVSKVVLRKGTGRRPTSDQGVLIHYTGSLKDGKIFDSSYERGPFHFRIGNGVISGWSIGVASMQVGEKSNFSIEYDYGYGAIGYPPVIPAKSKLSFEIELLSIE